MTDEPVTESRVEAAAREYEASVIAAFKAGLWPDHRDDWWPERTAFEQAVSEKARDEERRVWKSVAENAADWLWARGTASDGLAADLDHADALRARLAASPTEEANR